MYAPVNLDKIQHWIDQGRLVSSPEKPITARELLLSGCVHDVHDGIKILGNVVVRIYLLPLILTTFAGCGVPYITHLHHTFTCIQELH